MATRAVTRVLLPGQSDVGVALFKWTGLLNGDDGEPVALHELSDKSFQVVGTAGAGLNVVLEGDNSETVDKWFPLAKGDGTALSLTATPSGAQVLDHPVRFRPRVTAGDGTTNVTAYLYVIGR